MKFKHLFCLVLGIASISAFAQTPEEKGYEIQAEANRRDNGYIDSMHDATMTLRNAQGEVSLREFVVRTLEVENDGDKEIGLFHAPADVKGTAVLTFSHGTKPDDQWIYLPSLKRVKRVATVNKSGPFVGSEFAFEDISSWELDKYSYRYLRDEAIDSHDCFVIENYPVYEYSGYTKQIEWLDKNMYQPRRIEFYDRKGALLKVLTFSDFDQYLDRYWRAGKLVMENMQTGKSTELLRKNYRFRNNFSNNDFTENSLKNIR